MQHPVSRGSARTLLLVALALGAAVLVGSIALMAMRGGDSGSTSDADPTSVRLGGPAAPGKSARSKKRGVEDPDPGDPSIVDWTQPGADSRDPANSPEYVVDADSVRAVFKIRHWEELRRQIDELQRMGKTVPEDVVKALIEMLGKDDLRLDAELVLGGVTDDATGRALAQFALSPDASLDAREAALDALAKSGQKAALPYLQELVASASTDEKVERRALFAIGAVGGPDATKTLFDQLRQHADIGDGLHDAVVSALGKLRDGDGGTAAVLRAARDGGDKQMFQAVVLATQMQGAAVGPEVKGELQRMVESQSWLQAFATDEERMQMAATVLPAAAAAGIVAPVLRAATTPGPLRDTALESLVNARGDSAAKQIADALSKTTDETVRWKLTKALGKTASFSATPTLVASLDDPAVNVRNLAAQGLGLIRDPSAVTALLAHLDKSAGDYDFAKYLVESLGQIGANAALPALTKLAASDDAFWSQTLRPYVRSAITRINADNPDSMILDGK